MRNTITICFAVGLLIVSSVQAWAHGDPVRSFGAVGNYTTGGEVSEGVGFSIRYDRRAYDLFSDEQLLAFRAQGEDVHQHSSEETISLNFSVGLNKDWDLGFTLPAARFTGFKDNGDDFAIANNTISETDVSQGLGDLVILGRYRFFQKDDHHIAALMGVKLPTGDYRQRTNAGDLVGTHNQPGSGSVDFQLGVAYTGHLQDLLAISADLISRVNTEGAGEFRSGNSILADFAVGYRPHSAFVPFIELNAIFQQRDMEFDEVKKNSGVASLFVSPGFRLTLARVHTLFASYSVPLWQSLPGIQNEEDYRLAFGYGIGF